MKTLTRSLALACLSLGGVTGALACTEEISLQGDGTADASATAHDAATGAPDGGAAADDAAPNPSPDAAEVHPDAMASIGDPTLEVIDVGTVRVIDGVSPTVTTTLPPDVAAFMIVIDGPDSAMYVPYRLDGPSGNLVSDDASTVTQIEQFLLGPYAAQFKSPNRVTQDFGLCASLFPNNPGVTITGGAYRLVVGGLTVMGQNGVPFTGDVTVKYYYRRGIPGAGRLDLHLYFTGAGNITEADAPTNQVMQDTITRFREIYAQANVEVGDVYYHTADARFQTITDVTGTGGDLEELFQESRGQGRGLHYFFVDRFMGGFPGATIAGIAGGLPGAPDSVGTVGAGVAVALGTTMNDPQLIAHVMAHEGGHWLGLFHTSEVTRTNDQHPETPEGQAGNTYLMYPAVGGGTTISPSQGLVMRLHGETVSR